MNVSAANAFLKTCEEPLPHRIIIASTSNINQLLDTIISRAVVVKFQPVSYESLVQLCDEKQLFSASNNLKEFVCRMVMGKPGMLFVLQKIFEATPDLEAKFISLVQLLSQ